MFMENVSKAATLGAVALAATFSCAFPTSLNAQQRLRESEVRFAFRVGSSYMPAGHYVLQQKSSDGSLYSLKHSQTGKSVMVLCPVSDDSRPNRLVFDKDETGYVLAQVR
jgi:hypothetical protein